DVSLSMNATDVQPSRLAAAQQAAETLVAQLPESFYVGLVTFADKATVLVQPTVDHTKVGAALDHPQQGHGTVIGDGLSTTLDAQLQISSSAQLVVIIAVVLAMAAAVIVIVLSQRRPY